MVAQTMTLSIEDDTNVKLTYTTRPTHVRKHSNASCLQ